nr:hypothetical protein [Morchella crassipes]
MHLSSVGERDADGYGGGVPKRTLSSLMRGGLGGGDLLPFHNLPPHLRWGVLGLVVVGGGMRKGRGGERGGVGGGHRLLLPPHVVGGTLSAGRGGSGIPALPRGTTWLLSTCYPQGRLLSAPGFGEGGGRVPCPRTALGLPPPSPHLWWGGYSGLPMVWYFGFFLYYFYFIIKKIWSAYEVGRPQFTKYILYIWVACAPLLSPPSNHPTTFVVGR